MADGKSVVQNPTERVEGRALLLQHAPGLETPPELTTLHLDGLKMPKYAHDTLIGVRGA
jgi:hypothetical protein